MGVGTSATEDEALPSAPERSTNSRAEPSFNIAHEVDSPSGSGLKSIVAGPLDEYGDFQTLWTQLVRLAKTPERTDFMKEAKLQEVSSTEFVVLQTISGAKLEAKGKGKGDGRDLLLTVKYRVVRPFGRERRELHAETHGPGGRLFERSIMALYRQPLLIECWAEAPGVRRAGSKVARQVQNIFDTIAKRMYVEVDPSRTRVVPIRWDVDSPSGSGLRSCVSEPMEHLLDFEMLWAQWVDLCKYPEWDRSLEHVALEVANETQFTVTTFEVAASSTDDRGVPGGEGAPGEEDAGSLLSWVAAGIGAESPGTGTRRSEIAGSSQVRLGALKRAVRYFIDKAQGEVYSETYGPAGNLTEKMWTVFHRSPLRVEVWVEQPGVRRADQQLSATVQQLTRRLIDLSKVATDGSAY